MGWGDQIKHFYGLKSWREGGEGKCAGQQMLWQEKGNKLELKPTSGQKSFCRSQLGPSHRHSPTLGSPPQACGAAHLCPGMGDPSRPEMTTQNPPFPLQADEPELPEANHCLCLYSPQSKPGGYGENQAHISSKKPDCSKG